MVSGASIAVMMLTILLAGFLPIGLLIYLYVRERISFKAVGVGVLVFILFVMVLERLLHWYVLQVNPPTSLLLKQPLWYALYGGLAAGIFEETGRYVGFRLLLPRLRRWKDGVAYGLGHGGIETLLFGALSGVQNLIYAFYINAGVLESKLGAQMPPYIVGQIRMGLLGTPAYMFAIGGLERVFALLIQVGLSLVVLYGIKTRQIAFLFYAILIHALIDIPAALYQAQQFNIWLVEGLAMVAAVLSFIFIVWARRLFASAEATEAA